MDSTDRTVKLAQDGGSFANLATNAGVLTNGNCVSIDAFKNFVDAGGPCSIGGGGGTVSSSTSKNLAYYTATGTTVGGSTNLKWDNATQQLSVNSTSLAIPGITLTTGYVDSAGGFVTTSPSVTAIQAPNGQIGGKTLYASDSLLFAEEGQPALSGAGQTRIYMDSGTHSLRVSQHGSTYAAFGSGGGVSSITGTTNQVTANVSTGAVILSTPQDIATTSSPTFVNILGTGVIQSTISTGVAPRWRGVHW